MVLQIYLFLCISQHESEITSVKDWFDYQPILRKMSPHSSPQKSFGEDQSPDPGDGGNRAYVKDSKIIIRSDSQSRLLCKLFNSKEECFTWYPIFFHIFDLKLAQAAVLLILFHALPPARYTAVSETWTNTLTTRATKIKQQRNEFAFVLENGTSIM